MCTDCARPRAGTGVQSAGSQRQRSQSSHECTARSSSDASVKYIARNIRSKRLDSRSSPRHESQSSGPHDRITLFSAGGPGPGRSRSAHDAAETGCQGPRERAEVTGGRSGPGPAAAPRARVDGLSRGPRARRSGPLVPPCAACPPRARARRRRGGVRGASKTRLSGSAQHVARGYPDIQSVAVGRL